jgi:hypothetical protein
MPPDLETYAYGLHRYGTEPFASANGQIPQLNLWDDHDVSFNQASTKKPPCADIHRSLTDSVHMLTNLCDVPSSEGLEAVLISTTFCSNTISRPRDPPIRRVC